MIERAIASRDTVYTGVYYPGSFQSTMRIEAWNPWMDVPEVKRRKDGVAHGREAERSITLREAGRRGSHHTHTQKRGSIFATRAEAVEEIIRQIDAFAQRDRDAARALLEQT